MDDECIQLSSVQHKCNSPDIDDAKVREFLSQINLNTSHLTSEEYQILIHLIAENIDVFQIKGSPRGRYTPP